MLSKTDVLHIHNKNRTDHLMQVYINFLFLRKIQIAGFRTIANVAQLRNSYTPTNLNYKRMPP